MWLESFRLASPGILHLQLVDPQTPLPDQTPPARRSKHGGIAALLSSLEEISRGRPDRVLRLRGQLPVDGEGMPVDVAPGADWPMEPFELLIFRGFSSSVTHPTAFDPDRSALPEGARIENAELLVGPLNPLREEPLAGPLSPEAFLSAAAW